MSGEFICVAAALEVHVFLQAGRVAWATDSKHPFAFGAHLQETAKIDAEAFRHLVEECRRGRLPLGETIVAWGLASWDTVRASLSHQIRKAISLIAALPAAQVLFLERAYASYNERLTFDLHEFIDAPNSTDDDGALSVDGVRPSMLDRPGLAQHLRETVEGLSWVEVLDGDCGVEAAPVAVTSRVPASLCRMLADGTDFVAMRSARGSMVGLSLPGPRRSLWCRLHVDSTFGAIVAALWSATVAPRADDAPRSCRNSFDLAWSEGDANSRVGAEIVAFMRRAQELLGVVVLSGAPERALLLGFGAKELEAHSCVALAQRRAESLTGWRLPAGDASTERLSSIGFYLRTMVTGERALWCFGAELDPASGATLWLFTDRGVSQGLGWAYLAALTRALSRLEMGLQP
jgi:hypothetical protein